VAKHKGGAHSSSSAQVVHTAQGDLYKVRKKRRRKPRALIIVLLVLLALLLAVGAAFGLYVNKLQNNMAYEGEALTVLEDVQDEKSQPFYALIIGVDEHADEDSGRSDIMILARVDLSEPQVTLVTVPRDTPYTLDGEKVKLNEVNHRYGEAACVKAVSDFTGVPISHFVSIEFDELVEVVDSMGGVMVDVPYTIERNGVVVEAGPQLLNGEQALALSRARKIYGDMTDVPGDTVRQANVRAIFTAIVKNVLEAPAAEIPGRIQELSSMVKTDVPVSEMVDWANQIRTNGNLKIYSVTGPVNGDYDENGVWYAYEQPEQWAELMAIVDSGEDPTEYAKSIQEEVYSDEGVDVNTTSEVESSSSTE